MRRRVHYTVHVHIHTVYTYIHTYMHTYRIYIQYIHTYIHEDARQVKSKQEPASSVSRSTAPVRSS